MMLFLALVRRRLFVAAGRGPPRRAPVSGAPATPALSAPQSRGQRRLPRIPRQRRPGYGGGATHHARRRGERRRAVRRASTHLSRSRGRCAWLSRMVSKCTHPSDPATDAAVSRPYTTCTVGTPLTGRAPLDIDTIRGRRSSERLRPRRAKASTMAKPLSSSRVPFRIVTRFQPNSRSARRWPPGPSCLTVRAMKTRRAPLKLLGGVLEQVFDRVRQLPLPPHWARPTTRTIHRSGLFVLYNSIR